MQGWPPGGRRKAAIRPGCSPEGRYGCQDHRQEGVHLGWARVPGSQAGHAGGMQLGTESAGRGAGSSLGDLGSAGHYKVTLPLWGALTPQLPIRVKTAIPKASFKSSLAPLDAAPWALRSDAHLHPRLGLQTTQGSGPPPPTALSTFSFLFLDAPFSGGLSDLPPLPPPHLLCITLPYPWPCSYCRLLE